MWSVSPVPASQFHGICSIPLTHLFTSLLSLHFLLQHKSHEGKGFGLQLILPQCLAQCLTKNELSVHIWLLIIKHLIIIAVCFDMKINNSLKALDDLRSLSEMWHRRRFLGTGDFLSWKCFVDCLNMILFWITLQLLVLGCYGPVVD